MSNSSIWLIPSATTPGQSGCESDGNEGEHRIPQSSSITGALLLDCLISYPGRPLGGSHPSGKMQLVYSTAPADWADKRLGNYVQWKFLYQY